MTSLGRYRLNGDGVKREVRILEVDIHDWTVGLMIASIVEGETDKDLNKYYKMITYRVMKSLGFSSKKEYLKAYPGNYAFNSAIIPIMKLERFTENPAWKYNKNKYGVMESLRVYSANIFTGSFDDIMNRIDMIAKVSMKSNTNFGSLTVFPTIEDFMKYAKVDNPEKYKKKLWFCLDWKEEK